MATTVTPVLGLVLATPGTGEPFSTQVLNENFLKIDTRIGALDASAVTTGVFDQARIPAVSVDSDDITDATTVGKAVLTAADEAAAQTAIGATTVGKAALTAANAVAAREAMRLFKSDATFTPTTGDLRYRDA